MQELVVPGVPPAYEAVLYTGIGLLSSWLVTPLTALFKKLGRTTGVTTVTISAVLSLVAAVVFAFLAAPATSGDVSWWGVLVTAVVAFVKSNGDYLTRVQAVKKGASNPPTSASSTQPPDGLGDLP